MTEPLDYRARPKDPPARWSWCAVIGFALSLPGLALGFFLAMGVARGFPDRPYLQWAMLIAPVATGLTLSIIGVVITSDRNARIRGRALACAGIVISALWGVLFVLFLVMFTAQMF